MSAMNDLAADRFPGTIWELAKKLVRTKAACLKGAKRLKEVPEGHNNCCYLCSESHCDEEISLFWECRLKHHARVFEGDNAFSERRDFLRTHGCPERRYGNEYGKRPKLRATGRD